MNTNLTYTEKRALYESIMMQVSKQVKKLLNEANYNNDDSKRFYSMYDAKYNKDFAEKYNDIFKLSGTNIAAKIKIARFDKKDASSIMIVANNVGLLMQKLTILLYGYVSGPMENYYEITITEGLKKFWKKWHIQFTDFHNGKEYEDFEDASDLIETLGWNIFNDNSDKTAQNIAIELYKFVKDKMNNLKY